MICLEVVNLFSKDEHPYIFAKELYNIECIREPRPIFRKSVPHISKSSPRLVPWTYRSTSPCPTLYPKLSNLQNTASLSSSSSILESPPGPFLRAPVPVPFVLPPVVPAVPVVLPAVVSTVLRFTSVAVPDSFGMLAYPAGPSRSRSLESSSFASRYASGTSSISRRSRHDVFTNVAVGSDALYGGAGVSKEDIAL